MGRQRDLVFVDPPFYLKPVDRDGRHMSDTEGKRLQDHGLFLNSPVEKINDRMLHTKLHMP